MALDLPTLLVLMLISNLLVAAAMGVAFAGRFHDGLRKWMASMLLSALAWLALLMQSLLSETVSVMAANGFGALTLALQVAALLEFHRRPVPRWLYVLPFAACALFYPLVHNLGARMVLSGCLFGPAMIATGVAVIRFAAATPRTRALLAGSFMLSGMLMLLRALLVLYDPDILIGAVSATPTRGYMLLIGYAANIGCSLGFIIMHQERYEGEMRQLATLDPLTGVYNRRTFLDLARRELSRTQRQSAPLALLLLDLDHFKSVNDTYGHLAGDEVLVAFARLVQGNLRREDLVMRYGGEEFCVLLPGVESEAACHLAERMRAGAGALRVTTEGHEIGCTVSIGVAVSLGGGPEILDDILARADEALYLAKRGGRDRVVAMAAPVSAQASPAPA